MSELVQRVERNIHIRRLMPCGQKILVAVSGGVDSMVLLQLLHSLSWKNRWQLSVAHFNHRLRGRASDADEKLVRQTASKLKLPFHASHADIKAFAERSKISLEMAARKLRHEFLARIARERKISTIALAHHADDQVELFFLRLLRGAGSEGLAGMKWHSPSSSNRKVTLIRPLLDCSKAELATFARENKIRFRADATNFTADILRNRIRNELLPLLRKKYQPAVDKTVLRVMEIVGAEAEFVGQMAAGHRGGTKHGQARRQNFSSLPVAVQRKILREACLGAGVAADFDLVESLRNGPGKFVSVSPMLAVARDDQGEIMLRQQSASAFNPAEFRIRLAGRAGQVEFADRKLFWRKERKRGCVVPVAVPLMEVFDADKVGAEIILRHWRPGDRFQPIGLKTAVKLQDLFVNAKIPAARRRELLLATTAGGEVFWVEGLRIGELAKLTPSTKRRLAWKQSKFAG